jgi:Tfp pilus assembly major pilin PilA
MITLSWWEQFIVQAGISLLTMLSSKVTNPTEKAALEAALAFLQKLLGGSVSLT